ncbi:ABC transporter permease [Verminephrobacter eiseniae]|uniref:ABC transporter permease n=1 Tax=Verminephrobacter eiseniae TaxID=364317 RepID=UPI0010D3DF88|nr:ABC transporter permease [Verminephrobacter eiseniae]KAB7609598.1 ABC transporter permease [Verminephrobacter sp. Larva24]MCW5231204.1 ABC transporter permease [Verminephrobacter eiseniae]MCW5292935.1 ABC transporter permease [Verminephrobacter eiseniae]MCW8185824.1 ABC transporter permease [Verminephrobacter eiseniae]MCW8224595.1 ABC transporter permease [Verminephrobacter eiseniae]
MRSERTHDNRAPAWLKVVVFAVLAFMQFPILMIAIYSFNIEDSAYTFPPPGYTLKWFGRILDRPDVMESIFLSLLTATLASVLAIGLGSLAALAVHRHRFRGHDALNIMFNLPIALPGIITGIALLSSLRLLKLEPGVLTIIIGHTTFCVVIVYNNVIARLRRLPASLVEASMDLGADGFTTFRRITLPGISTAVLAGGILAFALSFDEIIVTTFTAGAQRTLPLWLLNQLSKPREMPITNVVALIVIAVTTLPIIGAYRLTMGTQSTEGASK